MSGPRKVVTARLLPESEAPPCEVRLRALLGTDMSVPES